SNTSLTMLGDTMKYVAPVASGLGVDLETAAAATGKLGDAGIQGSMAGTSLRAILGRLAEPPKMAAKALEELGIKTRDAKGNLRDFPELLAELDKKTAKMGNAQRAGFFKHIAGEEAFSA
ncbi:TPA: phage tail tape measure protein, partial [Proteus mirabilis]|nr:phage tail tape measure protein [Proteus mirabilis]